MTNHDDYQTDLSYIRKDLRERTHRRRMNVGSWLLVAYVVIILTLALTDHLVAAIVTGIVGIILLTLWSALWVSGNAAQREEDDGIARRS